MNEPSGKSLAARIGASLRAAGKFLSQDVWDVELSAVRGVRRALVKAVRVLFLAAFGFRRDECVLRASSLTFMTLLSVVPVLALSLSVSKGVMDGDELRTRASEAIHNAFATYFPEAASGAAAAPAAEGSVPPAAEGSVPPAPEVSVPAAEGTGTREGEEVGEALPGGGGVSSSSAAGGLDEAFFQNLAARAFDIVDGLNFRALGGIGLLLLVWTVVGLVGNVEKAFNRIWGVTENRPLVRKFTDYLSVIVVLPALSIAASSVPIVAELQNRVASLDGGVMPHLAGIPVFKTIWVLMLLTVSFSFLLRFTPNTRVRLWPGVLGGFVAAVGFSGWLKICLSLQIGVAKYSSFFGSFAAVPILLFWGYVSWVIVLVACEVSFAAQNADTYQMERGWERPSARARLLLAASLLRELSSSVRGGDGLLDVVAFNRRHLVPVRFVRETVARLVEAGVLAPVAGRDEAFVSRVDLQTWTVADLASALMRAGEPSPASLGLDRLASARALSAWLDRAGEGSPLLRELPEDAADAIAPEAE